MTVQQKKSNIILLGMFLFFELAVLVGAYALNYFTISKMGMMRHMVYLNTKWEMNFPISTIKNLVIVCLILIIALELFNSFKNRNVLKTQFKLHTVFLAFVTVTNTWTIFFLFYFNVETNRAYYGLCLCFILVSIIQNIIYAIYLNRNTDKFHLDNI